VALIIIIGTFVAVIVFISAAFFGTMYHCTVTSIIVAIIGTTYSCLNHQTAQTLTAYAGFAAALSWGLSVVGYLILSRFAPGVMLHPAYPRLVHSAYNGFFNLVAAIAAAMTAGFATI
jgi:hypothetical protein